MADGHKGHLEATLKARTALLNLQKELLDHLKEGFEKENARSVPPSEWLQVIMLAQRYAWMRELTSLLVDIDLLTELQSVSEDQAALARAEIEKLFFAIESASEFAKVYQQTMKAGAPFVLSHGSLREAVNSLPQSSKSWSPDEALAERKAWHEEHRKQSRQRRS